MRYFESSRKAAVAASRIRIPPAVGVPCFSTCRSGPSARICCPNSLRRRKSMKRGPTTIETTPAMMPATRTRVTRARSRCGNAGERLGDAFEREHARALHEHAVAGPQRFTQHGDGFVGIRDDPAAVDPRARPDGHEHVDADLLHRARDLLVRLVRVVAELRHLAEDSDAPPPRGHGAEVLER